MILGPPLRIVRYASSAPEPVIQEVLWLRAQHAVRSPEEAGQRAGGFLVGALDAVQIERYLAQGAILYMAYLDEAVGYLLSTSIAEFFGYFEKGAETETASHQEAAVFYPDPLKPGILDEIRNDRFIYQVATDPRAAGRGVATALTEAAFADAPNGLVADILVEPVPNETSIQFFKRNGFQEIGAIELFGYKNFGFIKTIVFRGVPAKSSRSPGPLRQRLGNSRPRFVITPKVRTSSRVFSVRAPEKLSKLYRASSLRKFR